MEERESKEGCVCVGVEVRPEGCCHGSQLPLMVGFRDQTRGGFYPYWY